MDKMEKKDLNFINEMKSKLDVELLGMVSLDASTPRELIHSVTSLLPNIKTVVVVSKEINKEVVALLRV
jgi:hypothetical protein